MLMKTIDFRDIALCGSAGSILGFGKHWQSSGHFVRGLGFHCFQKKYVNPAEAFPFRAGGVLFSEPEGYHFLTKTIVFSPNFDVFHGFD